MADNAFVKIDDWPRAQELADSLSPDRLHRTLDRYAEQCCPVLDVFEQTWHWSLMEVEYATDLVFRSPAVLGPLYQQLIRESVLNVKVDRIATFLGRHACPCGGGGHAEPGTRGWLAVRHPDRGDLRETPLRLLVDQNVRQGRDRASDRSHGQRRVLFQAPPESGTSERPADTGHRTR
jgi:hypothetical protein